MKINRRFLSYFSVLIVSFFIYSTLQEEQWVIAAVITALYLAFIFGIDKVSLDIKNKKIEIDDTNKE